MATSPRLHFVSFAYDKAIPTDLKNSFVIRGDNWNDYGSYVRFNLYWCDKKGDQSKVGSVKILQGAEEGGKWSVAKETTLPKSFSDDIGPPFISLGQSEQYYSWIRDQFGDDAIKVLEALRDISVLPGLASRFDTSTVFRNALLRENAARRARRFGEAWSQGLHPDEKPSFSYACQLSDDEQSFTTKFDFSPNDTLPGRVVGLIGRNAVGKTRFLAKLSNDLAQNRRISAKALEESDDRFPGERPLFNRILAVSYSAFDKFRRPNSHPESSYVYCGIRDESGGFSQVGLQRSFRANKARVREHGRDYDWVGHIAKILGETSELSEIELRQEIDSDSESSVLLDRLSSGQAILCHFVTGLLAWLESESLVLFDEPETHLHPNAVANLFVVLTEILYEHKSYAIVATHSPVVVQEIPSHRVLHFTREDGVTYADPLRFESFGEGVGELTEHVFRTSEAESPYRDALDLIARKLPLEQALTLFHNPLGMNAKAYLLARYVQEDQK